MSSIMEEAVLAEEVSIERDHIRGRLDAPVTLVEYGDYQCPYCAIANKVVHAIEARMSDQVRFVFRHFPMTTVHPHAAQAAEAAEAAGKQKRFWAMHDALFQNQSDLRASTLAAAAMALGLDIQAFTDDLARHAHLAKVRSDFKSGVLSGVNGTPAFYINGTRYDGSWDLASLSSALLAAA
jgi:protein-disulfide isomerase